MPEETNNFKKIYNLIGSIAICTLLAIVIYGFASNLGMNLFVFIFLFVLPFPLNYYLAVTRRKNVFLMLVLTLVFSWLVTLILAFMPVEARNKS
jgi:hypothetical protein